MAGPSGETRGTDDGPVEAAGAKLCFHAFLVRHGSAEEDWDESAKERRHIGDAVADPEGGDGDEAADAVALHGGDEVAGDVGFECGPEEWLARADGVDDGVLAGDGGVEELRVAGVTLEDARAVQGLRGRVMHECGDVVAELAGLLYEGQAGLAVGADDEQVQMGAPGDGVA